jgi:hypothetical protein
VVIERKQYNVGMTDGEIGAVERSVVGVQGGTAIRVAALSWARAMERVVCDPVAEAVKGNVAEVANDGGVS